MPHNYSLFINKMLVRAFPAFIMMASRMSVSEWPPFVCRTNAIYASARRWPYKLLEIRVPML